MSNAPLCNVAHDGAVCTPRVVCDRGTEAYSMHVGWNNSVTVMCCNTEGPLNCRDAVTLSAYTAQRSDVAACIEACVVPASEPGITLGLIAGLVTLALLKRIRNG